MGSIIDWLEPPAPPISFLGYDRDSAPAANSLASTNQRQIVLMTR